MNIERSRNVRSFFLPVLFESKGEKMDNVGRAVLDNNNCCSNCGFHYLPHEAPDFCKGCGFRLATTIGVDKNGKIARQQIEKTTIVQAEEMVPAEEAFAFGNRCSRCGGWIDEAGFCRCGLDHNQKPPVQY